MHGLSIKWLVPPFQQKHRARWQCRALGGVSESGKCCCLYLRRKMLLVETKLRCLWIRRQHFLDFSLALSLAFGASNDIFHSLPTPVPPVSQTDGTDWPWPWPWAWISFPLFIQDNGDSRRVLHGEDHGLQLLNRLVAWLLFCSVQILLVGSQCFNLGHCHFVF